MAGTRYKISVSKFDEMMEGRSRDELVIPAKFGKSLISIVLHRGGLAWHIRHLSARLGIEPEDLLEPESADLWASHEEKPNRISWKEFTTSADQLGKEIKEWGANTIFTFAGPSMIAAGLVMSLSNSVPDTFKIPTYTGFFVHDDEIEKYKEEIADGKYHPVHVNGKSLLVPTTLLTDRPSLRKKICVLDDAIITGHTMNALREYFRVKAKLRPSDFMFGAVVCHESQRFTRSYQPKCFLYKEYRDILMPWKRIAEPFEVVVDASLFPEKNLISRER